jgi:hypothetical protein
VTLEVAPGAMSGGNRIAVPERPAMAAGNWERDHGASIHAAVAMDAMRVKPSSKRRGEIFGRIRRCFGLYLWDMSSG